MFWAEKREEKYIKHSAKKINFSTFKNHCLLHRNVCVMDWTVWAATWENRIFAYAKTKTQISFAVTAKLISVFVFATRIVQSLYFLNPKFRASSHLQWLSSPVCVGPGRKPRRPVFSRRGLYISGFSYSWKFNPFAKFCSWARIMRSRIMRKRVSGVSNQVWHKPGCTITEVG